ncbi:hypothetical protein O6H91_12G078200 [Diphasiastrum complanatum]|uniref:Uncharacterized protein n=2 Tax=Diphasiastrum complanatum TaxID=34168 RepID=A0ACC2C3W2_DIPCM|nr:hypothetical protein O6H91_12G078200 [Diphasiastrum complanatum]KAJ7536703.1 hypothetical protein O6H91_12G078200 [Diphasiastrum complanatum]
MHMGRYWLLAFLIALAGIELLVLADGGLTIAEKEQLDVANVRQAEDVEADLSKVAFANEVDDLKSKLKIIEGLLDKKEVSLQDKANRIHFLENKLESIQVERLPENVRKLEFEIQTLKERAESSEAIVGELLAKNAKATRSIEQQQKRINSAEEALRLAEAALRRAESEAAKRTRDVSRAYEAWFPTWAASRIAQLQEKATAHWVAHGEPIFKVLVEKVSQNAEAAHHLAKPHIETFKMKWLSSLKMNLKELSTNLAHHMEIVKSTTSDSFKRAEAYISPHLKRAQEVIGPYTELARKKSSPYATKVSSFVQPYYKSFRSIFAPYTKKLHKLYKRSLRFAKTNHYQLQRSIKGALSRHEYSAKLASKEVIWFLASALLLLPALGILLLFSSHFGSAKKTSKPTPRTGTSHAGNSHKKHRRPKQVDK